MEYLKSVVPIIESNYDNFTTVEKKIADFFIHNKQRMKFASKEVAAKLYVSEASLSRFAKKCGYRGYRDFIYQYEENFLKKETSVTGNRRTVLNVYQELLNKTYNLVDESQIHQICKYMNCASRLFICGLGSSGLAASEMEFRFMRVGVDVDALCDADVIKMRAVFQDKSCLVFGITISGETEEVLFLLREAHEKGAKTVLFTAKNKSEFSEFCDEVVLLPSLLHLNHGNVISPQFPMLVMADICYSYYLSQDQHMKETLHDSTLQALRKGKRDSDM